MELPQELFLFISWKSRHEMDDWGIPIYGNAARCKYLKIGVWDRFGEEKINSTDQLGPQGPQGPSFCSATVFLCGEDWRQTL